MIKILSNDRVVGAFGAVPAGDTEKITRLAVGAVRAGFGVVPCQEYSYQPACALGVRDAKKEHDCYHVITSDTKARSVFNRLTKDGATCNIAIDLEASGMVAVSDRDYTFGDNISPTLLMPSGGGLYLFERDTDDELPEEFITDLHVLMPPSTFDGAPVRLVGQTSLLSEALPHMTERNENMDADYEIAPRTDDEDIWGDDTMPASMNARVKALENEADEMSKAMTAVKNDLWTTKQALKVALTALKEIRNG